MSEKKMKFKAQPRVSDHPKDRTPVPVIVPVSGGAETGSDAFEKVPAHRKSKQDAEGLQPISGSGQSSKLADKLGAPSGYQLERYMSPDGKRGSISTKAPKAFAKYAKKLQSGE